MFCTDLILRIMTVLKILALVCSYPSENHVVVSFKMFDSQQPKEYLLYPECKTKNIRHRNKYRRYLETIAIKSKNVLGKFEQKEKQLQKFYQGFWNPTSNQSTYQKPRNFLCLNFKEQRQKVSKFRKEIRQKYKQLRKLIALAKSPKLKKHVKDEGRLKMLQEFLAEIKNLLVELRQNNRRKKSVKVRMSKKSPTENLANIKSQTKIKLVESKLLSSLKIVLENWTRDFKNTTECK